MSNTVKIVLILTVVIGLISLLNYFQGPKHNWGENYNTNNSEPFGLEYTMEFIKRSYPDQEFIVPDTSIVATLRSWTDTLVSNYIHVGGYFNLDTAAHGALFDYVNSGNNALFILKRPSRTFMERLNDGECSYYWEGIASKYDTVWRANFTHPDLKVPEGREFMAVNKYGPIKRYWNYFPKKYFCEGNYSFTTVGTVSDSLVNFIRVPHGDGFFYVHTNPILFSNYFITQPDGVEYARDVFSHLNEGTIIYEDLRYLSDFTLGDGSSRNAMNRNEGPFKYIMSQESLRWAMYTLLGLLFIYVFFGIRRKQKMIPVILTQENSSIEYVETISELYFQSKGKNKIAQYLFDQYYEFIRLKYQLTLGEDRQKFLDRLVLKSEISSGLIKELNNLDDQRNHRIEITQDDLITYYKKLENFYAICK